MPTPYDWLQLLRNGGNAPLPPQVGGPLPPEGGATSLPPVMGNTLPPATSPAPQASTPLPPTPAIHSGPFGAMVSDYAKANSGIGPGGVPGIPGGPVPPTQGTTPNMFAMGRVKRKAVAGGGKGEVTTPPAPPREGGPTR